MVVLSSQIASIERGGLPALLEAHPHLAPGLAPVGYVEILAHVVAQVLHEQRNLARSGRVCDVRVHKRGPDAGQRRRLEQLHLSTDSVTRAKGCPVQRWLDALDDHGGTTTGAESNVHALERGPRVA